MNSLSWFLYIVDVLGAMKFVAFLACILVPVAAVVTLGITALNFSDAYAPEDKEKWRGRLQTVWQFASRSVVATFAIGIFVIIFVPSKNTMYAIAASEVGEKIAANESVQGIASDATNVS